MGQYMKIERICDLVEEAHELFNTTSIFDVIDLDKSSAKEVLNETYRNPRVKKIERYLDVIERLKQVTR